MGTWGVGSFENDTAADWKYLLEESKDASPLEAALRLVVSGPGSSYPDTDQAVIAIAAAEVVAAALGAPAARLPSGVVAWIEAHPGAVGPPMASLAGDAVLRVRTKSELLELWEESDSMAEWSALVDGLQKRLSSRAG